MANPAPPTMEETRRHQMYPVLTAAELKRIGRFGRKQHFKAGELLARTGEDSPGMSVILSGRIAILGHDGLGHVSPIVEMGPGDFAAELAELSGQPAMVDVRAEEDVEALIVPHDQLRALMVAEAELGERIMRALILRRVRLIEVNLVGPILVGELTQPGMIRLQGFLTRNGQPHTILDPETRSRRGEDDRAPVARRRATIRWSSVPTARSCAIPASRSWRSASACCRKAPSRGSTTSRSWARAGRSLDRRLCRLRRPVGAGRRNPRLRRPGRRQRPHRELSRLPDRHLGPGADRARLRAGAEVRRAVRHSARSGAARLRRRSRAADDPGNDRRLEGAGEDRRDRLGRALSQALAAQPRALPESRPVVLGLAHRGEALRQFRGGHRRWRQFGGPGGGVPVGPCREGLDPGPWQRVSPRRCRAT